MGNKLQIADELRTLLPTAIVKQIIATRETTDVVCVICGRQVPASSPETLNVIVSHDRDRNADRPIRTPALRPLGIHQHTDPVRRR